MVVVRIPHVILAKKSMSFCTGSNDVTAEPAMIVPVARCMSRTSVKRKSNSASSSIAAESTEETVVVNPGSTQPLSASAKRLEKFVPITPRVHTSWHQLLRVISSNAAIDAHTSLKLYEALVPMLNEKSIDLDKEIPDSWYMFDGRYGSAIRTQKTVWDNYAQWSASDCDWYFGGRFQGYHYQHRPLPIVPSSNTTGRTYWMHLPKYIDLSHVL
ncbi:hypothetical protein C8R43DRAFT_960955 [Mycena crocata]|nr:hypothetical protein C8R43DRAFT_960955 [Mycena crocata]